MGNVLAILRRDLSAYFTSPIGYIFMMVFVSMSVGLYITSFFAMPVADMRPYFDNLPIFLCVFIPAVTMRIWAEERKENTWEMLLTFPMQAWELVLGKFFAAFIFFSLTLFATITVPAMLFSLGNPDTGAMLSGYIGTLFLGAFFLALGIFFSGFFKDQIVAFVVTLLTCFLFLLVGADLIASYINDRVAGLGTLLADVFGVFAHYAAFTRGVIDLADIIFFSVWTIIFLGLNVLYIDGRNRPGAKTIFSSAVVMCMAIGLLFNWLMVGQSIARIDMTEDKIYTISTASRNILDTLDAPVQVRVYITSRDKMPMGMKDIEQDIVDKLEELRVASNGRLNYSRVYLEVGNLFLADDEDTRELTEEEMSIEMRMLDKGVQPFQVQAFSDDGFTSRPVYAAIGIGYRDRPEEIIPQVVPQTISELEYNIVSTIYKLNLDAPPVVALVAPKEAFQIDEQTREIMRQMGQPVPQTEDPYIFLEQTLQMEKYEVHRVELTQDSPLPDEYDTLVVVNPRNLNDRQRWEINRALHSGKSVVMAVQQYEWDYETSRAGMSVTRREEQPGVNELLTHYGLAVSEKILMDANHVTLRVQGAAGSLQDMLTGGTPVNLPMQAQINLASMDQDTSITSRLSSILYLWGTPIELDDSRLAELGLNARIIMRSSAQSWLRPENTIQISSADIEVPYDASQLGPFPLMAVVEGQFPDAFADMERPGWPAPDPQQDPFAQSPMASDDPEAAPVESAPGKLVLLGCSQMFRRNFMQAGNLDLFLNSVDAVTLSENLVHVRGRKPVDRTIDRPTETQRTVWRVVNYGLANTLIALIGIGSTLYRRHTRNLYTMARIAEAEKVSKD